MADPAYSSTETKPLQQPTSLPMENAPNPAYPPQQQYPYPNQHYYPQNQNDEMKQQQQFMMNMMMANVMIATQNANKQPLNINNNINTNVNNNNNNAVSSSTAASSSAAASSSSGGEKVEKIIVVNKEPVYVLKPAGCCVALMVLFMNLCIPGWGTIFGACFFTSICSSLVCEGIIQFICIPILYGWCRALCTSIAFLNSACSGLALDRYYT